LAQTLRTLYRRIPAFTAAGVVACAVILAGGGMVE
jgi:hypothetical protein